MIAIMKLNRTAIQSQFLGSEFQEILPFYRRYVSQRKTTRTKGGQYKDIQNLPTNRRTATKWRIQAKKTLLTGIKKQLEIESTKEISDSLKMDVKQLIISKKALFTMINSKIQSFIDEGSKAKPKSKKKIYLEARDIKIYVDLIKTELGEPTNITKNENKNQNVDEELGEEQKLLVQQLKSLRK